MRKSLAYALALLLFGLSTFGPVIFDSSLSLAGETSDRLRILIDEGLRQIDKKEFEHALQTNLLVIELDSESIWGHYGVGLSYESLKKYDMAADSYRKAISLAPELANAHFGLGNALRHMKVYDKAAKSYREAIRYDPTLVDAYAGLGTSERHTDDFDGAIKSYIKALEIEPNHAAAHYGLGMAYGAKKVAVISADHFYTAGTLYLERGERDQALLAYKSLKILNNERLAEMLFRKLYPEWM